MPTNVHGKQRPISRATRPCWRLRRRCWQLSQWPFFRSQMLIFNLIVLKNIVHPVLYWPSSPSDVLDVICYATVEIELFFEPRKSSIKHRLPKPKTPVESVSDRLNVNH
jgi:hypothetical protein